MSAPPPAHEYARRLRYARKRAGLTQQELARASRVQQPRISRYERGRFVPRPKNAAALATALGATDVWLEDAAPPRPPRNPNHDRQIVARYQLLRRFELGRSLPGDQRPSQLVIRTWRRASWLRDALACGVLPPSPEQGGELGFDAPSRSCEPDVKSASRRPDSSRP